MAYITAEEIAVKRKALKEAFPGMNNNPNGRGGLSPEAEILTILRGLSQEEQIEVLGVVLREINVDFQNKVISTGEEYSRVQTAFKSFKSLTEFLTS